LRGGATPLESASSSASGTTTLSSLSQTLASGIEQILEGFDVSSTSAQASVTA
jgi:hypothetical protein